MIADSITAQSWLSTGNLHAVRWKVFTRPLPGQFIQKSGRKERVNAQTNQWWSLWSLCPPIKLMSTVYRVKLRESCKSAIIPCSLKENYSKCVQNPWINNMKKEFQEDCNSLIPTLRCTVCCDCVVCSAISNEIIPLTP